ncbi:hypothetical protein PanWU01x14_008900 [Parasponia andersonii]|uniref:Uncharacterized protein n=1 Tax=Parasponia andersonii TaxID=3476 RepID=A0A2P5E2A2_PARAD|nr:hypothetical protein PanWU01x14_008900 [Parasponia andersonii]
MELTAQVSELTKKENTLSILPSHCLFIKCQICGKSHPGERCLVNLQLVHFIMNDHIQQSYPHLNFYNSSWEAYHDYSWCNNQDLSPYFYDEPMLLSEFPHQPPK